MGIPERATHRFSLTGVSVGHKAVRMIRSIARKAEKLLDCDTVAVYAILTPLNTWPIRAIGGRDMINFDKLEVEIQCPRCSFYNPIFLKQARLRDVVICRGCKANIRLDDQMNETRKAARSMQRVMNEFQKTLHSISKIRI